MQDHILDAVIEGYRRDHTADEVAVAERVLREYNGTIPDSQLISEAALAVVIRQRERRRGH